VPNAYVVAALALAVALVVPSARSVGFVSNTPLDLVAGALSLGTVGVAIRSSTGRIGRGDAKWLVVTGAYLGMVNGLLALAVAAGVLWFAFIVRFVTIFERRDLGLPVTGTPWMLVGGLAALAVGDVVAEVPAWTLLGVGVGVCIVMVVLRRFAIESELLTNVVVFFVVMLGPIVVKPFMPMLSSFGNPGPWPGVALLTLGVLLGVARSDKQIRIRRDFAEWLARGDRSAVFMHSVVQ
jgi:hypothetical protein